MSWGNVFHADEQEDSFWPSFTDIMMVIVMTFLLVTVAVVMTNTRLLDELRHSLVAEREANQRVEFTLQENATLEEQLDYYQQRSSSLEMELLRSRARQEETQQTLASTRAELAALQASEQAQARTLQQRDQQLQTLQQDFRTQSSETSRLQNALQQAEQQRLSETERLQTELAGVRETLTAANQRLQTELEQSQSALSRETSRLETELQLVRQQLSSSEASAQDSAQALAELQARTVDDREKLASLEGDFAELDKKYQKLLKPTRSAKGKTVVAVMYQKSGYRIKSPDSELYRSVSLEALNNELAALKAEFGDALYVKIVIPENSGLSYNQAWVFTRDTLNKYDYYYQDEAVGDADEAAQQ